MVIGRLSQHAVPWETMMCDLKGNVCIKRKEEYVLQTDSQYLWARGKENRDIHTYIHVYKHEIIN